MSIQLYAKGGTDGLYWNIEDDGLQVNIVRNYGTFGVSKQDDTTF